MRIRHTGTPQERLMKRIEVQANGCWKFIGGIDINGYGVFSEDGHNTRAHRSSYKYFKGPIPEGLDIDHVCHKPEECPGGKNCPHRLCVNPDHLEPVTREENTDTKRAHTGKVWGAIQSAKTHCPRDHEYNEVNTRWSREHTERNCRACDLIHSRNSKAKIRAAKLLRTT